MNKRIKKKHNKRKLEKMETVLLFNKVLDRRLNKIPAISRSYSHLRSMTVISATISFAQDIDKMSQSKRHRVLKNLRKEFNKTSEPFRRVFYPEDIKNEINSFNFPNFPFTELKEVIHNV